MLLKTGVNDNERRIDRILRKALPDYPLSLIHRLLRQGKILVDGRPAQAQDRIPSGAEIMIPDAPGRSAPHSPSPTPHSLLPTPHILWQDSNLLILNKPAGLAVHGQKSLDTLVQRYLAGRLSRPENASLSFKPGPLHRLDKPSSGAIAFSMSLAGARDFSSRMREGKIRKQYLAVVDGRLAQREIWSDGLARDKARKKTSVVQNDAAADMAALTTVLPLAVSIAPYTDRFTLIAAEIHTGRTHQIRVQAAAHGHPLMGDKKYGSRTNAPVHDDTARAGNFFLHAWKLKIDENTGVSAPLPEAFQSLIKTLFGLNGDSFDLEQLVLSASDLYN